MSPGAGHGFIKTQITKPRLAGGDDTGKVTQTSTTFSSVR